MVLPKRQGCSLAVQRTLNALGAMASRGTRVQETRLMSTRGTTMGGHTMPFTTPLGQA
jgi:hypothetical protein